MDLFSCQPITLYISGFSGGGTWLLVSHGEIHYSSWVENKLKASTGSDISFSYNMIIFDVMRARCKMAIFQVQLPSEGVVVSYFIPVNIGNNLLLMVNFTREGENKKGKEKKKRNEPSAQWEHNGRQPCTGREGIEEQCPALSQWQEKTTSWPASWGGRICSVPKPWYANNTSSCQSSLYRPL